MKFIDDFLNTITMYRLVLYVLLILAGIGLLYSALGILPFDPRSYAFSFLFVLFVSLIVNWIFAKTYEVPTNVESVWITGLILALIISPPASLHEIAVLGWAAILAVASKFILSLHNKHIFNPAAIAIVLTVVFINGTANWWIGTTSILPITAIGGFLIIRKIRRFDLALSFFAAALATILTLGFFRGTSPLSLLTRTLFESPMIFFASIMLTEPLTTPPTKKLRIIYGAMVGLLFAPQVHLGSLYTTPELALVLGNVYAFFVSPKYKLLLGLKERIQLSPDTFDFVFPLRSPITFTPGQYMEFTLAHPKSDSRGNRRYLSLASSPTESEIRLGVKIGNPPSSYKKALLGLTPNQKIAAGQLIGDFVMPKDPNKKLAFIAGGIGITPFRSMLKYLIDTGEKRDIIVLYTASDENGFVYRDILDQASQKLGIQTVFINTRTQGHATVETITRYIPDYDKRFFYVSGSHGVVTSFEHILRAAGIEKGNIVTDYFPGFA